MPTVHRWTLRAYNGATNQLTLVEVIRMSLEKCLPRTDWFGLASGFALLATGTVLTVTAIGAVIGIPMVLGSFALFTNNTTLRGTPCAS